LPVRRSVLRRIRPLRVFYRREAESGEENKRGPDTGKSIAVPDRNILGGLIMTEIEPEEKKKDIDHGTFTIEKMRKLIMQTNMCRKDKNCGACRRVNFCAIWNNRWPDIFTIRHNGLDIKAYADYRLKDIPVTAMWRLGDAVSKTFDALMTYMEVNHLYFAENYDGFVKRDDLLKEEEIKEDNGQKEAGKI
jgi:hypothetical protein